MGAQVGVSGEGEGEGEGEGRTTKAEKEMDVGTGGGMDVDEASGVEDSADKAGASERLHEDEAQAPVNEGGDAGVGAKPAIHEEPLCDSSASVQVLCNLLRRLEFRGGRLQGESLLCWLRSEKSLALAMGSEGVAQHAQLEVVISMLELAISPSEIPTPPSEIASSPSETVASPACAPAACSLAVEDPFVAPHPSAAPMGEYEVALLQAVELEIASRTAALRRVAARRDACALALLELRGARARARAHCEALRGQLSELELWTFFGSAEMRRTLVRFQEAHQASAAAAERIGLSARALETLSVHLSRQPSLPRRSAIDALRRLLGRLAYTGTLIPLPRYSHT